MSSLAKGSLLIALGTLYKILLTIIIDKYLAIQLSVEDFGQFKLGITIVLLLSTFGTLGFNTSIVRTLAIHHSMYKRKILVTLSIAVTGIFCLLIILLGFLNRSVFGIEAPFLLATLFFGINTLYSSIYSGLEKPSLKTGINDLFGFTIYLFFLCLYFTYFKNSVTIAYTYLAYVIAVFLFNLVKTKKYFIFLNKQQMRSDLVKEYVSYTAPLFGVSILLILSANIDKVVLNYFVSEENLGVYYSVFNISNLLPLILTILVFMYLPRISKLMSQDKMSKAKLLSSYSSKWTMIMASVFFGAIYFYGEEIIALLYTEEFTSGVFVLQVLAFGQWINVSLGFTGQNLLAIGDSKSQLKIRLFSFIIGTVLLYFGAKLYGNMGASVSILVALLCSNILQILVLKIKHGFVGYRLQNLIALIFIISIGLFLSYLHNISVFKELHFIVSLLIDIILFTSILLLFKVVGKRDLIALKIAEG